MAVGPLRRQEAPTDARIFRHRLAGPRGAGLVRDAVGRLRLTSPIIRARGRSTLMDRMHQYRLDLDAADAEPRRPHRRYPGRPLLSQNISFFTSNTILLIGGLVAVLGARDQVLGLLADIPLVADSSATRCGRPRSSC